MKEIIVKNKMQTAKKTVEEEFKEFWDCHVTRGDRELSDEEMAESRQRILFFTNKIEADSRNDPKNGNMHFTV